MLYILEPNFSCPICHLNKALWYQARLRLGKKILLILNFVNTNLAGEKTRKLRKIQNWNKTALIKI